jgi:hypothetical protein
MSDLVRTQILLNREQHQYLVALAAEQDKSLSEVVREFLNSQIRRQKYYEMQKAAKNLKAEYDSSVEISEMTALDREGL